MTKYKVFFLLWCWLAIIPFAVANQDPAGIVIAAKKSTWAKRYAVVAPLKGKSPVFLGDTLITNEEGKLHVLFNDNSMLMLAPNSETTITEYIYGESSSPRFGISLVKGMTRFVSGDIVKQDPGSMQISTPHATIGIQGTLLTVTSSDDGTTIYLEQVSPDKPLIVTVQNQTVLMRTAGVGMTINPMGEMQQFTLSSQDKTMLQSTSSVAKPVAAALAPEQNAGFQSPLLVADVIQTPNTLDSINISHNPPTITPPTTPEVIQTQDFSGTYTGNLHGFKPADMSTWAGTFTLSVANLTHTPTITQGSLNVANTTAPSISLQFTGSDLAIPINSDGHFAGNVPSSGGIPSLNAHIIGNISPNDDINFQWDALLSGNPLVSGHGMGHKVP